MNKAYLMSFVFAAALPAMALESTYNNTYTNFLKGVTGDLPTTGVPTAEGGAWTSDGDSLTNNNGKVEFAATDELLRLDVTTPGPADTNTIVRVELEVSVADVGTLMNSSELTGAQTAFAVCTNAYHAWNGESWVVLGDTIEEVGDDSQTTNLTVEIKYLGTNGVERGYARAARFTIGDTTLVARDESEGDGYGWITLETTANNFTGFGASGSGLLSKVDAEVMLGVAEYAGVKYGSISNAIEAAVADGSANKPPVEVLRETEENITLPEGASGIEIADNGNVKGEVDAGGKAVVVMPSENEFRASAEGEVVPVTAGDFYIPVNVKNPGTVTVNLAKSYPNKEVVDAVKTDSAIKVTIQTATHVLEGAEPDGKALTNNIAKLREYLNTHTHEAYVASDVSSSSLETVLEQARTGANENGLPLYQSYALGIAPTESVKPVAVANDTADDGITLAIPAVVDAVGNRSGDYTIKYSVDGVEADVIKVPLNTGSHTVKIVFK